MIEIMNENDLALFKEANRIVSNCERDCGQLRYGEVVDLLADNTEWPLSVCQSAHTLLVADSRTRFAKTQEVIWGNPV